MPRYIYNPYTMTDETKVVETIAPDKVEDVTKNTPEQGDTAKQVQHSGEKAHWYRVRQMEKLKKKQDEEIALLKAQLDSGELKPDDDDVAEVLVAKEMEIKKLKAEQLFVQNGEFGAHKDKILEAIDNPKYANLSPEEIAKLVIADELIANKSSSDKIQAHNTGTGASAREAFKNMNKVDYKEIS